MSKSFLISTITAAALGYSASFATNALIARAGIPQPRNAVVEYAVGTGAAQTTLEGYLEGWLCDKVVDDFGIDAEDCTVELFKPRGVSIVHEPLNEGEAPRWLVRSNVGIVDGTWTPGLPQ